MQPFAFVVHTETMSEADHRAFDQQTAELFTKTLSTLGNAARRFRPNRRPARPALLTPSHSGVGVEQ